MSKVILYATPAQVQNFVIDRYSKFGLTTSFPHALFSLKEAGLLSESCPALPPIHENMSAAEFDEYMQNLPFNASNILEHDYKMSAVDAMEEVSLFPWQRDVFCLKHMPYMDEEKHFHNYFEITYIYRGSCKFLFENESINLIQGDLCIIPPLSPHNQPLDPSCLAVGILVRKSTFDSIFGGLLTKKDLVSSFFRNSLYGDARANYLILRTELLAVFRTLLQQLVHECSREDAYANACSISLLNLFLAEALRRYSDTITIYRIDHQKSNRHEFALILQYIQQNYQTVTLETLAKTFHYSETYLSKLTQDIFHQSFTKIVRSLKMARAVDYLENTSIKVSEIATLVGYDSVDHFSRTFKKTFAKSPQDYRKAFKAAEEKPQNKSDSVT